MTQGNIDAIVVGGGVSGLTAAFHLQKRGFTVEVLEAADRTGGVIASHRRDGVLWESGPNSTLDTTPLINETLEAAGILGERLDGSAASARRFVIKGGQPVALPGSAGAFATTGLFSLGAKLRLVQGALHCRLSCGMEETVADFVRRRLGREFLDYAIEPFVAGIYAGDPELLSVRAAFPKLHALEQRYGSLIKGQFLGARERKRRGTAAANTAKSFSFREGMQTLTDALARGVERMNSAFASPGSRAMRTAGFGSSPNAGTNTSNAVHAVVVLAVPASEAARIVGEVAPDASRALARSTTTRSPSWRARIAARTSRTRSTASASSPPASKAVPCSARCSRRRCSTAARSPGPCCSPPSSAGGAIRRLPRHHGRKSSGPSSPSTRRCWAPRRRRSGTRSRAGQWPSRNTRSGTWGGSPRWKAPKRHCPDSTSAPATAAASRSATASGTAMRSPSLPPACCPASPRGQGG